MYHISKSATKMPKEPFLQPTLHASISSRQEMRQASRVRLTPPFFSSSFGQSSPSDASTCPSGNWPNGQTFSEKWYYFGSLTHFLSARDAGLEIRLRERLFRNFGNSITNKLQRTVQNTVYQSFIIIKNIILHYLFEQSSVDHIDQVIRI